MGRRDAEREGDAEGRRKARDVLERIGHDAISSRVELTDAKGSRFFYGVGDEPALTLVSRHAIAAGPEALTGEVAHECAHFLHPQDRRDAHVRRAIWAAWWVLAIALDLISLPGNDSLWPTHPAIVNALWNWPALAITTWSTARISHRRELRTDRLAALLLGSPTPVMAMLARIEQISAEQPRWLRLIARNLHPLPRRRREHLASVTTTHTSPAARQRSSAIADRTRNAAP